MVKINGNRYNLDFSRNEKLAAFFGISHKIACNVSGLSAGIEKQNKHNVLYLHPVIERHFTGSMSVRYSEPLFEA